MATLKGILSGSIELLNLPLFNFYPEAMPGHLLDKENLINDWHKLCKDGYIARKTIQNEIKRVKNDE